MKVPDRVATTLMTKHGCYGPGVRAAIEEAVAMERARSDARVARMKEACILAVETEHQALVVARQPGQRAVAGVHRILCALEVPE